MLAYEIDEASHIILHALGIALVVGRALHAWGLWQSERPNFGRVAGQSLTWLAIAVLAVFNLWLVA